MTYFLQNLSHFCHIGCMECFTQSLQDAPTITVNNLSLNIQTLCHTSTTKKKKGFTLYSTVQATSRNLKNKQITLFNYSKLDYREI